MQRRSFAFDAEFATANLSEWMAEFSLKDGGAKEKADKDAIWVNELTDELTVAIALRESRKNDSLRDISVSLPFYSSKQCYLFRLLQFAG